MEENSKKKLGLFDLTSIGVGSTIGSGIFAMLGIGILYAGRGVSLAIVIAMFAVFMQFIRNTLMATAFVLPGGMYDQNSLVLPTFFSGANAVGTIIGNVSLSVMGIAIASYVAQVFPVTANYQTPIAAVVMTLLFATSIKGSKFMARIQNVMVVCMYAALFLFIIFGLINRNPSVGSEPFLPQGGQGLLIAVAMMSYTCQGANSLVNLAADAKEPKKSIPLATILTVLIATVIYVLLAVAATSALPYEQTAGQNLGFIAKEIMPSGVYMFFMIGGAIFALTTTLLGAISTLKWPILATAKDGWLPSVFKKETKNGFPWVVMLTMYLVGVVPIIGGFTLDALVSLIVVPTAIISIASNIFAWNLPTKFPKAWAENSWHMSAGVYRFLMVISIICSLVITVYSLIGQEIGMIILNLGVTVFLFVFGWIRSKSGKVHIAAKELYTE